MQTGCCVRSIDLTRLPYRQSAAAVGRNGDDAIVVDELTTDDEAAPIRPTYIKAEKFNHTSSKPKSRKRPRQSEPITEAASSKKSRREDSQATLSTPTAEEDSSENSNKKKRRKSEPRSVRIRMSPSPIPAVDDQFDLLDEDTPRKRDYYNNWLDCQAALKAHTAKVAPRARLTFFDKGYVECKYGYAECQYDVQVKNVMREDCFLLGIEITVVCALRLLGIVL